MSLVFSNDLMPPRPNIPSSTGSMVEVSACGISTPNPTANGEIKKFTAKPNTQTQPVAGRHDD
jgi:hypothetical protein